MLKVVIDSNVWVSSLLNPGTARAVTDCFETSIIQIAYSQELLDELTDVLSRPNIVAIISRQACERILSGFAKTAIFVELKSIPAISRDPKDDPYLACAQAADCDFLVTGDKDLLVLKQHGRTRIVTPAQFLAVLKKNA